MDVFKLAILAFVAAGIVLWMANVSLGHSVLISGGITVVIMLIAIWRTRKKPQDKNKTDESPRGPTIK